MKTNKLLILTEKFPPNTETAANRPWGWARYFSKYGYKPIIVTRNWDLEFKNALHYQFAPSGTEVRHEIFDTHEVYYLPYKGNLRTKILARGQLQHYRYFYWMLSLLEQVALNLGLYRLTESSSFFRHTLVMLKERHKEFDAVLATGCPFYLFNLAKVITCKYRIPWIADYRDPWTIPEGVLARDEARKNFLHRFIERMQHKAELRWVKTAGHITSVSDFLTRSIAEHIGRPGTTIYNGYFADEKQAVTVAEAPGKEFVILYNGSLYPIQKIEIFIEGFKMLVDRYKNIFPIRFEGIGIDFIPEAVERVKKPLAGYESSISVTGRIPKPEYLKIQAGAQLLLIAGTGADIKGITSSKIFDYILTGKPVLLVGNDKDVIEQILLQTGQGIFADTPQEVFDRVSSLIEEYRATGQMEIPYNRQAVDFYSRDSQTRLMAGVLNSVISVYNDLVP